MNTLSYPDQKISQRLETQPSQGGAIQVIGMLAWREWVRFFRQPFRVIAALGQPILFWILFGTGMHSSFRGETESGGFMVYFVPGTVAMILLFTAIFATISIIEDRREGFLQSVLVAPTSRFNIAMGKIIGGSMIAWIQACLFVLLAIIAGTCAVNSSMVALVFFMMISAIAMTSLGVCFAWPMDSTQGFHALMNMVLMPMWLLSGSFFPIPKLVGGEAIGQFAMHWIMRCNPMTYVVAGLRHLMQGGNGGGHYWGPSLSVSWIATLGFAVITIIASTIVVRRNQKGELQ